MDREADPLEHELLGDLVEAGVLLADQVGDRHPRVGEAELRGVRAVPPQLGQRAVDGEARGPLLDDQQADAAVSRAAGADRGGHEVGADAAGDEGLGAVDDVVVAVAPRGRRDAGDVGPAARLGDREAADQLARQGGSDEPVDQVGVAAGRDVRQGDAAGEEGGHQPARGARLEAALLQRDAVEEVTALAADRLGERDAEQALLGGLGVQLPRHLAGVLPRVEVRRDLAAYELAGGRPERLALSRVGRVDTSGPCLCGRSRQPLADARCSTNFRGRAWRAARPPPAPMPRQHPLERRLSRVGRAARAPGRGRVETRPLRGWSRQPLADARCSTNSQPGAASAELVEPPEPLGEGESRPPVPALGGLDSRSLTLAARPTPQPGPAPAEVVEPPGPDSHPPSDAVTASPPRSRPAGTAPTRRVPWPGGRSGCRRRRRRRAGRGSAR